VKKTKNNKAVITLFVLASVLGACVLGQRTQKVAYEKVETTKPVARHVAKKKSVAVTKEIVTKKAKVAKVAIVIDDFGYNTRNLPAFFNLKEPLTFSILPNLKYSADVANAATAHGCEVILHMPMASSRKDVKEEPDTLKPGDSKKIVETRLAKAFESVPGVKGLSNHMGSKATEDKILMTDVLTYLKKRNLYFFDSLTSEKSVCHAVADSVGTRFAKRDLFLDNSNNVDAIGIELADLEKIAFKRGHAIAICHDRKNTVIALAKVMPQMVKDGVEFVYLSEMEK
jgi:hypothetical protein